MADGLPLESPPKSWNGLPGHEKWTVAPNPSGNGSEGVRYSQRCECKMRRTVWQVKNCNVIDRLCIVKLKDEFGFIYLNLVSLMHEDRITFVFFLPARD